LPLATLSEGKIKSFEIKTLKHDLDDTVPQDPQDFLRYVIYKTTGQTLLIKNKYLIDLIKNSTAIAPYIYFNKADVVRLAEIFFRYKPLFLAFKSHDGCAPIINYIRRLADKFHGPLPLTGTRNFSVMSGNEREEWAKTASTRDLIKVYNALKTYEYLVPRVYQIRNGRTYVNNAGKQYFDLSGIALVKYQLTLRLKKAFADKSFVLSTNIHYSAPVSEKQFLGNIPYGTLILPPYCDNIIVGIHWFNQKDNRVNDRVDLDLHLKSTTMHYGWNSSYRGNGIVYSGDMTDAPHPKGAAEAYYIGDTKDTFIVSVNNYTGQQDVEFTAFLTNGTPDIKNKNYTYDVNNNLAAPIPLKFTGDNAAMTIGLINEGKFYITGGNIENSRVPSANYEDYLKGLLNIYLNQLSLYEILAMGNAKIFYPSDTDIPDNAISLLPEDLTTNTLINLIDEVDNYDAF